LTKSPKYKSWGSMHMDIEKVPLDVPKIKREAYLKNYMEITRESGKLMLFAGDQKVEHLKSLSQNSKFPPMISNLK
jgi:hypothetical protein